MDQNTPPRNGISKDDLPGSVPSSNGKSSSPQTSSNLTASVENSSPSDPPPPGQAAHRRGQPDDEMLEYFGFFGRDDFAVAFFISLFLICVAVVAAIYYLPLLWIVTMVAICFPFLLTRHFIVKSGKYPIGQKWIRRSDPNSPVPDISSLPSVYFLYVLGSGGHSAEMIETVKRKFRGNPRQHRRYIVTTGDNASRNMILELEIKIRDAHPDDRSGTFDVFEIQRARAVHQSMWTAPFTCLLAAAHAINALTSEPKTRPKDRYGFEYKYPHVIITNGPATGFIVGLVAHLLKILAVVPKNRLKMVYIESWARSRTLSLTGKLYLWTGIANMFCVQHESLANRIRGAQYVGIVAARTTPVG